MTVIDRDDFLARPFDSFSYYEYLPSSGIHIVPDPSTPDTATLAARLLDGPLDDDAPDDTVGADMDALTIRLLNRDFPAGFDGWEQLADRLARQYAALLVDGSSRGRPLRMRSQRLLFCIRDLCDRDVPVIFTGQRQLPGRHPWDWLDLAGGTLAVTCDHDNLRWTPDDGSPGWSLRCGLPSQLDLLDDGSEESCVGDGAIGVGSLFSPGGAIVRGDQVETVLHNVPAICLFRQKGLLHFLDEAGRVVTAGDGAVPARLPEGVRPWRARRIDGALYVSDWSRAEVLFRLDLATGDTAVLDIRPVLICNDICRIPGGFAVLDKERGNLFLFDENFRHVDTRLAFGRGPGRLYDPITVRAGNGRVETLNWFDARIIAVSLDRG